MPLSDELLEILVCPQCRGDLEYDRAAERLICARRRLRYPDVDEIPLMQIQEAEPIPESRAA